MIPYIELRDKTTKRTKAIITPTDCFFELSYYGTGEFMIICPLNNAIKNDDFITIPNQPYIWVIQSVNPKFDVQNGYMLTVKGFQAKYILNWRINLTPYEMPPNLASAVYGIYSKNINPNGARNMGIFYTPTSINEPLESTIATRGNVYDLLASITKLKQCGFDIKISSNRLLFGIYRGFDKSNTVIFSRIFDNLLNSDYLIDGKEAKTFILAESEDITASVDNGGTGLNRKELYFESGVGTKYTDAGGNEIELDLTNPTDIATFTGFLTQAGREELTKHETQSTFNGTIDTTLNQYKFGIDYYLGDKIKIEDSTLAVSATPRVLKYTISQNRDGYGEEIEVGEE